MTPAEVNAEIARLRGWTDEPIGEGGDRIWRSTAATPQAEIYVEEYWMRRGGMEWPSRTPPPYCGPGALTGLLLTEMVDAHVDLTIYHLRPGVDGRKRYGLSTTDPDGRPCECAGFDSVEECAARAWLAWKRAAP